MSRPELEFSPLLDWVEGRLPPQAAQDVTLLLAGADAATLATLAWIQRLHRARPALPLEAPPEPTRALLRERFAAYAAARAAPGLIDRVAAALSFDSLARPAAAHGARTAGALTAHPRQLVFSCSVADIALNLHRRPHDELLDVSGQIFPHGPRSAAGWGVVLVGDVGPDATSTDDLGEFGFDGVAPGDYTLSLQTDRLAITMPMVALAL